MPTLRQSSCSKLLDLDVFDGVSRKENYDRIEYLSDQPLQHLEYVINKAFEITKEELKQKINITQASVYLKSESMDRSRVSSLDVHQAAKKIHEAENSLKLLKGTARFCFNHCRLLLAKSDLCLRQYQLKKIECLERLHMTQKIAKYVASRE